VQQFVTTTFVAGDVLDVNCTSAGSSSPAGNAAYCAWFVLEEIVVQEDTDGGPYMDLVMGNASLVSYWGLADTVGTAALDHTAANHGTYIGSPSKGQAALIATGGDGCVDLNGTSQYVTIPGSSSLQLVSFTLEAWVRPDTVGTTEMIMDIGGGGYVDMYFTTGGAPKLGVTFWDGSFNVVLPGATTITAGVRRHVAATWDNATKDLKVYINGVQDATSNNPGKAVIYDSPTISSIGAAAAGSAFFDGKIDDVAIYNTALSAATLLGHYNQGVA
jgi:hypothetical protein